MKIVIDNGHGLNTPGKRSPVWADGSQLLEWRYTREIATRIEEKLKKKNIPVQRIVPEYNDVPLWERCRRVNKTARAIGPGNCLLISLHVNASTTGNARRWEIHTGPGQTLSDTIRHPVLAGSRKTPPQRNQDAQRLHRQRPRPGKQLRRTARHHQALKTVTTDSKVDDVVAAILGKLLPKYSTVITAYKCYLEEAIPKWLHELQVAQSIVQIEDKNEQLVAIINALNISDTKSAEYLEFATKCLYYLDGGDDGKLGWEDCRGIVQEYYEVYVKA